MLPSLLVGLPTETPVATIVGTNKVAQVVGNLTAGVGYLRKQRPDWRMFLWTAVLAGLGAVLGARIVTYMSRAVYTPILLVVLVIMVSTNLRTMAFSAAMAILFAVVVANMESNRIVGIIGCVALLAYIFLPSFASLPAIVLTVLVWIIAYVVGGGR